MRQLPRGKVAAFTTDYRGRARVLQTQVRVGMPFDPEAGEEPVIPEQDVRAIWDTGATNTLITQAVANRLALKPIAVARCSTVSGEQLSNVYLVSLFLPNRLVVPEVRVYEGKIKGGDVLIGMDVIGVGDFAVTNYQGNTVMSFRIPSKQSIDFVADERAKTPRNAPCPCGSGKKYKHCCMP